MTKSYHKIMKSIGKVPQPFRNHIVNAILGSLLTYYADINVEGRHILEKQLKAPTLFISNHLSNIDGPILYKNLKDNDVAFVAGIKLQNEPLTKLIADTIETIEIKPNTPDKDAIKKCVDRLRSGKSLLIFPEGTRSRKASLLQAKKGFILIAKMSKAPIVPIGITGTDKLLPINDKNMGTEVLHKAKVNIKIGHPFMLPSKRELNGTDYSQAAADFCMSRIAELLPLQYRGYYGEK